METFALVQILLVSLKSLREGNETDRKPTREGKPPPPLKKRGVMSSLPPPPAPPLILLIFASFGDAATFCVCFPAYPSPRVRLTFMKN